MAGTDYDILKDGFEINGKKVIVLFLFRNYWRKHLESDYRELMNYHQKIAKVENPMSDIDLKFYHTIRQFPEIPYDYFKEVIRRFVLRIVNEVLRDNPGIVTTTTDTFEIQFKVSRNDNKEWYGAYDDSISDTEHAYIEYNGLWLLNTIVVPWIVFRRIDYKLLYKFFQHELSHHKDLMNKRYFVEDYAKQRIRPISRRLGNYSLFYLYLAFENLRVEGLHEFSDKRYMQRIEINMEWVRNFRKLVEELITIRKLGEAEEFFERNLGSISHQGIYYVGRLASQTIALAVAKKEGLATRVSLLLPDNKTEPLSYLNSAMKAHAKFFITQIPVQAFEKAVTIMERTSYRGFIRLYEWACNELGIEEGNRIVTHAWFDDLKKRATKWYESHRLKMLGSKGYIPAEYAERMPDNA
ncbi:hypothetical protein J4470_03995 [Candidatus Woesearchaeota archaeon]|nr:hypothetical protein [Candidatus Woesearchaeota archaeon]